MNRLNRIAIVTVTAASLSFTLAMPEIRAVVVDSAPTWPIPLDVPFAPPPIASLPAAGAAQPPAELIADPVTPAASCSGWYLENNYGGRWPAGSTWWEYQCTYQDAQYHNTCPGPACDAFCPTCYWQTRDWTDYFFWNGSEGVFYGEAYSDAVVYDSEDSYLSAFWWDGRTARWYSLAPRINSLTVYKVGDGFGLVSSSPAGIGCGDVCDATFDTGTIVTLTATPDASSIFFGWSGDCYGTDICHITMNRAHSAFALFGRIAVNAPPHATFTAACSALACTLDASGSIDTDGWIANYVWDFGDGSVPLVAGPLAGHTYAQAGTYVVTLTVTDNAGAGASGSNVVSPMTLSARGFKYRGANTVDLSWIGPSGMSFDLFRNGVKIATLGTTTHTDAVGRGSGSYTYKVCDAAGPTCSNAVTVGF